MKLSLFQTVCLIVLIPGCFLAITRKAVAQSSASNEAIAKTSSDQQSNEPDSQQLLKKFEKRMSGSKLVGQFTIDSKKNDNPNIEEYHILTVRKLENGDYWEFKARIKYGNHDLTVPIPVEVKWAANTPVITVNQLTIPGLGTFDARVLIRKDKYAGTWSHNDVGGHMFGKIKQMTDAELKNKSSKPRLNSGDSDDR